MTESQLETQKFIDASLAEGVLSNFEIAEAQALGSQRFNLIGQGGVDFGELLLEGIEALPENQTERKIIRKYPFRFNFQGKADAMLEAATYKLTPVENDSAPSLLLYIKPVDVWPEEGKAFYESVIN